jgi:hypothetical protein
VEREESRRNVGFMGFVLCYKLRVCLLKSHLGKPRIRSPFCGKTAKKKRGHNDAEEAEAAICRLANGLQKRPDFLRGLPILLLLFVLYYLEPKLAGGCWISQSYQVLKHAFDLSW